MKNLSYILMIFTVTLMSCEKELVINADVNDQKIVMNSLFNNQDPLSISVTESLALQGSQKVLDLISSKVSLYKNEVFLEFLNYSKNPDEVTGRFYSSVIPEMGFDYKIQVEDNKLGIATATSALPTAALISDAIVEWTPWGERDTISTIRYNFEFTITDPQAENYYYFTMSFPTYLLDEQTGEVSYLQEQYTEILTVDLPKHQLYIKQALLFDDKSFNGLEKRITGTATTVINPMSDSQLVGDIIDKRMIRIELHSLSKEAYNFHSSYAKKLGSLYDVYAEPIPVFTNIENGLGIFAGENIVTEMVEIVY